MAKMYFTLDEACSLLQCDEDRLKRYVREGKLREFRDAGNANYKAGEVESLAADLVSFDIVVKATNIARRGHRGQKRRNGDDYLTHPFRMMDASANREEEVVSALHDVVEDSPNNPEAETFTLQDLLKEGIPQNLVDAVDSVTKREEESYLDFILRSAKNAIGKRVKLLDLNDNLGDSTPQPCQSKRCIANADAKYIMAIYILKEMKSV